VRTTPVPRAGLPGGLLPFKFTISDPLPSIGEATVAIQIKKAARVVATIAIGVGPANDSPTWSCKVALKEGLSDLTCAGHRSRRPPGRQEHGGQGEPEELLSGQRRARRPTLVPSHARRVVRRIEELEQGLKWLRRLDHDGPTPAVAEHDRGWGARTWSAAACADRGRRETKSPARAPGGDFGIATGE
jgi:hypothetical protein